jgi:hypothetical protein
MPEAAQLRGEMRSLVIRAWLEAGSPPHIRARIVEIALSRGERPVLVTTSIDEVCRAVRSWLEALQALDADATVTARRRPGDRV